MRRKAQHLENVKKLESLNIREIERAIRDAMIAELEAVKQYETIADSISIAFVKKVLQDIADEEKVHVGELQKVLKRLNPGEKAFLEEGEEEVKEMARDLIKVSKEIIIASKGVDINKFVLANHLIKIAREIMAI